MSTRKPRINVTVDDELNEILKDLYRLTGKPKATFINELLVQMQPVLAQMRDTLEMIELQKNVVPNLAELAKIANEKTAIINGELYDMVKQIDWVEETND